jgi:hypothetical protein
MEMLGQEEKKYLECIKCYLVVSSWRWRPSWPLNTPRITFTAERPSAIELEQAVRGG